MIVIIHLLYFRVTIMHLLNGAIQLPFNLSSQLLRFEKKSFLLLADGLSIQAICL